MHILKRYKSAISILLLTFIGGVFRFYNLSWDNGYSFHPDERNIANAVSQIKFFSQLNPNFFAYGGFLIYLYRITGDILNLLIHNTIWTYDWSHINIIGRFYSALFSMLTIPLIFILSKDIFNKKTAIIASLFTAFCVSLIQTSHFSITENFLVLISLLMCLVSFKLLKTSKLKAYILCGIFLGLAVATKTTALSLIIFPLTAHILTIKKGGYNFLKRVFYLFIFLLTGIAVFTIFSPYTFLKWNKFMESMRYESGVALGTLLVPYTLQFNHTLPYIFQINNFIWQIGPIAYLFIPSFIFFIFMIIRSKNTKFILFLSFPLIYFLYVGYWHTKFIRFMLPILPFIIMLISYFLYEVQKRMRRFGKLLIIVSVFSTVVWALAFFSIYIREQTRVAASEWIYQNIQSGSKILGEHWDDGLPVSIGSNNPSVYNIEQLTIYNADNQTKINYYAEKLFSADYIVINSRRLYGTLINLSDKYPITNRYYKLLFSGKLGYEKIGEFTSYPSILGITINDDSSEETFQVYDHPKVIIFKNLKINSKQQLFTILNNQK